ncbi:hypothetical protein CH063_14987, partial [Colletotrichum higginsianum]
MQLIRHVEKHEDFFLPSPDDVAWDLFEKYHEKESASVFSEIEAVYPATEIQRDILHEDVQWAEVELFSGKPASFGLESVFNAWSSLASHHICLRSYITTNHETGQPQVVVLRRIEDIRWHNPDKRNAPHESPA